MSIYKRDNSPYWQYDFTVRGKRFRGSTEQKQKYSAGQAEAKMKVEQREMGRHGVQYAPILREFATTEFLPWVDNAHSIEAETRRSYRSGWKLLSQTKLAEMPMDAIRNHDCETIKFPGSGWNANHALKTLRRIFGKAIELKAIREAPKIALRKVWGRSISMTETDAAKIAVRMPDGDPKDAFLILRATGMRPKECFSLRWEFVDFEHLCYRNPHGKTRSSQRAIPLLGNSLSVLQRRQFAQGSPTHGWVFRAESKSGRMVTIAKAFSKARDGAGLPKGMVLYTARHGAATDLASVASLKTVMETLGHSSAQTAMRYQHPDVTGLQAKLDEGRINGRVM